MKPSYTLSDRCAATESVQKLLLSIAVLFVFQQRVSIKSMCFFCHGNALTGGRDTTETLRITNTNMNHVYVWY